MEMKWLMIAVAVGMAAVAASTGYSEGKKQETLQACYKAAATNPNIKCEKK